ncbi:MAG: asparaginase [Gemmatimonadota bacterium]
MTWSLQSVPPLRRGASEKLCRSGSAVTPVHDNCSGQHAAMLGLAVVHGWPVDWYLDPGHPLQERILREMVRYPGLPREEIETMPDGCGMVDSRRRTLIQLSAALAAGDPIGLRRALEEGALVEDPLQVEEVLLQSYLFLGYPVALNAFALWREITGREAGEGVRDNWPAWGDRGEELCRTIYGGQYEGLRRNVRALHPDMERWMVVEGYGKVLGRPGLDLATRELCIAALLAVLRTPRQLHSHLRGALNAGAHPQEIEEVLTMACVHLDDGGFAETWEVWDRVRARALGTRTGEFPGTT